MALNLDELPLPDELPAIPDGWCYESLGDLVEERGVSYGIVQPGSETADGVPIVRVNNIRNGRIDTTDMLKVEANIEAKFQRSRLRGGEVLLTLVGTLGEVAIVPEILRGWNVARAVGVIPVRKDPGSLWVSICLRSAFIQHCIRTWSKSLLVHSLSHSCSSRFGCSDSRLTGCAYRPTLMQSGWRSPWKSSEAKLSPRKLNHEPQRIHRRRRRPQMARGVVLSDRARARSRGRRAFSGVVFVWRGTVVGAYAGDDPAFELLHIIPPRYPTLLATAESVWREIRMFNEQSHMNILSTIEKQRFESLFGMETGYVLNFTDQSFAGFFRQDVGINISDPRFSYNGPSKAKRLRAFWEIEEPTIVGRALEKLLELWRYLNEPGKDERADGNYEYCVLSAARLLGRELKQETESDFLRRDFGAISVEGMGLNVNVEQILGARVKEAIDCVAAGAALSAILMCGSVLEGLLLSVALKNPAVFNCASGSPKQKDTGKVRPFHEWTLASLIDVAHEVGVLRLDVKKFGHGVRDFRNYIHPYEQMASKFTPDQHTAQICLQVLRAALVGLKENRGMVPSI